MTIEQLSAALPNQVTLQKVIYSYAHPQASGLESYVDLVITNGGILNGTFDGYCIDTDRPIDFELDNNRNGVVDPDEVGDSYTAKVYSSYEPLPTELMGPGLIEKSENLDLLNWIINQDFAGQASLGGYGNYTFADVQRAIWTLIDDTNSTVGVGSEGTLWKQNRVDEIVNAAKVHGEGFVPGFGQKMGVLIVPEMSGDGLPDAQIMFAAVALSKLGDRVFEDRNANGIQEAGETGIAGTTVNLLADINGDGAIAPNEIIASTTTDSNGNYSFTVIAGNYKVQVETPEGFDFASPVDQGGNDAIDSDGLLSEVVTLAPGENNTTIDSGFYRKASLGDRVWYDTDQDGIQDDNEKGVADIQVTLVGGGADGIIGNADDTVATTTTDTNGYYKFEQLNVGEEYQVQFDHLPSGYGFTQADAGSNDGLDSDANPVNGKTQIVTLLSGEHNPTLDAGIVAKPASLGDRVWYDTDKDGIQDTGEQGVQGVKVILTGGGADGVIGNSDDTTATTVTDANGNYRFDHLNAGEEYKVTFTNLPNGYQFTQANAAESSSTVIFESSFETTNTNGFVAAPLEGWKSKDGYLEIRTSDSADGRNHIELNDDAIDYYNDASQIYRDVATEAGKQYTLTFQYAPRPGYDADVNAMEVRLDGSTLLAVHEDGSDNSGYNWKTYTVSFEGDGSTKQLEFLSTGTALAYGRGAHLDDIKLVAFSGSNDDTLDSDVHPSTGMTQTVVLAPGEYNSTLDAGIVREPVCAKLVGTSGINEGSQGNYYIQLDEVSDRDRYFTIQVDNGSAKRVDQWAGNQDIMWGGYYDVRQGVGGRWLYNVYNRVSNGTVGSDRPMVGPSDASWDFTLYQNGKIASDNTVTVKVAAGQSVSNSFQVQTWKERVTVDRDAGNSAGYFEGTETFSMKVVSADSDKVCNDHLDVSIYDKTSYGFVSPIALDLNGDGIQTLSLERGITFDLLNTGEKVQTGWLSGQDGFLAIDNNGNGQIDDRSELFGGSVGEGFAKLASFDSNGDGWVNASDTNFSQLRVWQDLNENALTESGELKSLAEAGIESLKVDYTSQFNLDAQGNLLGERSSARSTVGHEMAMVDVYFQVGGLMNNSPSLVAH